MKDYSKIETELINYAKLNPKILGISRGFNPEYHVKTYFLLIGDKTKYNEKFSDEISDLDIKLNEEIEDYIDIIEWPRSPNNITENFLGDLIYKRK